MRAIARLSEIQIDMVKQCIQHLLAFGIVQVFDLFQFTNLYIAGKNLVTAICAEAAFWNEVANQDSVEQVLLQNEVNYSLEECRDLIRKGLQKGMLVRLHRYVLIDKADTDNKK